jgi:hypothetical protein
LLRNKWSYFIDMEGHGLKLYIKPASTVIEINKSTTLEPEYLRKTLVTCMKEGKWLTFNFGDEDPTKIFKYLE